MADDMQCYVLDKNYNKVDIVENFTSLIWTDRFSSFGDFEITTSPYNPVLQNIQLDSYLKMTDSGSLMVVEEIEVKQSRDEQYAKITGRSAEIFMERRVITQDINNPPGAVQLMFGHMRYELVVGGNTLTPQKGVPGFYLDEFIPTGTPSRTATDYKFKGKTLYEVVKTICDDLGVGFSLWLDDNNKLVFRLQKGTTRLRSSPRTPVIYSTEFHNLNSLRQISTNKTFANFTYIDMEPSAAVSKVYWATLDSPQPSGLNRWERYLDGNSIKQQGMPDDWNQTTARWTGEREIRAAHVRTLLEAEADTNKAPYYGTDYFLGDTIVLENGAGGSINAMVTEFVQSYSDQGVTRYPTFSPVY